MNIRVVFHLSCGHRKSGTILPHQIESALQANQLTCDKCHEARGRTLISLEELRPLKIA